MNSEEPTKTIHPWGDERPYNDLPVHFRRIFGLRVQKLAVNAGFTCPNRDGTVGTGGCTYCNNSGFNPGYCDPGVSVTEQLEQGMAFFDRRYGSPGYLAYFQAYTNTYGPLEHLKELYNEALDHPRILGLVIGTRPDCVDAPLLDYFSDLAKRYYICLEYGLESTRDDTLKRINRGHTWRQSVDAIIATAGRGIQTGAHMIIGLPGEEEPDFFNHIGELNRLPLHLVKFHQLQIVEGTAMAREYHLNPESFDLFAAGDYIDLMIRMLEKLNPGIIVERFVSESAPGLLIAPKWGLKNFEVVDRLTAEMKRRGTWQGRLFTPE